MGFNHIPSRPNIFLEELKAHDDVPGTKTLHFVTVNTPKLDV